MLLAQNICDCSSVSQAKPVIPNSIVINLARHSERLRQFKTDWEAVSPALCARPELFYAIDAKLTGMPLNWVYRQTSADTSYYRGAGAWGCYRSHLAIIESLLNHRQYEPTLILEDDAFPVETFNTQLAAFLAAVPQDWDMLFLGGQHICSPVIENAEILRCVDTSRSHAYVVRGEELLRRLYQVLSNWAAWPQTWYADQAMTNLQLDGRWNIFAPPKWLFGQRAGYSECALCDLPEKI